MKSYLYFPSGYCERNVPDEHNGNMDVSLVLFKDSETIYHYTTTIFTVKNITFFIERDGYFSALDSLIIDNLEIENIKIVVNKMISNDDFTSWMLIDEYKSLDEANVKMKDCAVKHFI